MNCEDTNLEEALCDCTPARLEEPLLGRLTAVLDAACVPVLTADAEMEAMLARHRPARLPSELSSRLTATLDVGDQNITPMPIARNVFPFRRYAAAAAIALVGAVAALLSPIGESPSAVVNADTPSPRTAHVEAREFVPAAYVRGLSDARDEGVVWNDNAPHRVLRIVYTDTLTLRNAAGEVVEVENPCIEYILFPEKID